MRCVNTLDVSPAGDRGFRNYVDIKESSIEPITIGLSSVSKYHLHRRYVTGVCTVIVRVEWMPFLVPVHGNQSKAIRSGPPLENLWQAVQKWVSH
jgi:hypothetical protein